MPTFMVSMNWTEQGIKGIKDAPKRIQAGRELAKKVGVEIKHLYLTAGGSDLVLFVDAPNGDNIPNLRWRSARRAMCTPGLVAHGRRRNS